MPRRSFFPNLVKIRWKMKIFGKTPKIGPLGGAPDVGSKFLSKIHFIYQNGPSVQIWWKLDENWRFSEKRPKMAPRGAPGGGGQKFYQKVISYVKRVLLSKFGENQMKNEDFLKIAQNWPLEGALGARVKNFTKKSFYMPRGSFCPSLMERGWKMKSLLKIRKLSALEGT